MNAIDNHIFADLNRHERAIKEIVESVNSHTKCLRTATIGLFLVGAGFIFVSKYMKLNNEKNSTLENRVSDLELEIEELKSAKGE